MPPAIIGATIATAGAVGSAVIASNAQKKAQKSAQEEAQRQEAEAKAEQQRIEQKFGLSPEETKRQEEQFRLEEERRTELERRAGVPGEELLKELGPSTRQLLDTVAQRQGKTGEELFREEGGAVAGLLLDELSQGGALTTFGPELDLVLQKVNQESARRGVFEGLPEGGIRFEQLGRAGVDLAIKGARERLAQQTALATQLFNITGQARTEAGQVGEAALSEQTGAREELGRFLGDIQTLTAEAKGRELSATQGQAAQTGAAQRQAAADRQSLLGVQAGQAARTQQDILGGLGSLGEPIVGPTIERAGEKVRDVIFEESRTEEDPVERLLARTRGGITGALGRPREGGFVLR